jgi:2-aminobenzoate-CoA ligase
MILDGAHVDRFTEEHLPAADAMPEFVLEGAGLHFPARLNAVAALLDRHVDEGRGGRRAIVVPGGVDWTYDDLQHTVNKIANVLVQDLGVIPGTRVLLRAPNSPMLAAALLAVIKAGAVAVPTMPLYRASELKHIIAKARVGAVLCDASLRSELNAACAENPSIRILDFNVDTVGSLEAHLDRASEHFHAVPTRPDEVALILFTSGTTGTPKAALHFQRDLLAVCETYCKHVVCPKHDDLFAGTPPLAFAYGLGGLLLFPLWAGAAMLFPEKSGPEELLRVIAEFGVTTIFTSPIAYRAMDALMAKGAYDLSTLRTCASAGETLAAPVFDAWFARTNLRILDGIGSTELLHIFIGAPADATRSGSTGRPVFGYLAEIHDDDGNPLPDGETGRLAVKGPTGCKYLDDERQRSYVRNGWNYPGDAYRRDADGYFYYVARTDDMIVSAGFNISGPEVEQALLAHANVKECAVVGKPDAKHGTHIVKAYVVTDVTYPTRETAIELQEHVKALIAPFKAPREIEFVDELPRTATGKVQRFKLRERAASE